MATFAVGEAGTAGGSVDVPLGKRGSWLFSARRSYIDVALDIAGIASQGLIGYPRTLDFTNKMIYDLTTRNRLSVTAMNFSAVRIKSVSRAPGRRLIRPVMRNESV